MSTVVYSSTEKMSVKQTLFPRKEKSMIDDFVHVLSEDVYKTDEANDELGRRLDQLGSLGAVVKIPVPEISDICISGDRLIIVTVDRSHIVNPGDKIAYKKRLNEWCSDKPYRLGGTVIRAGVKTSQHGPFLMVKQNFIVSIHKVAPILVMLKNIEYLYVCC